jgi:hypothetical protein
MPVRSLAAIFAAPIKNSLVAVSHALLACALLGGCDFFSTREFAPHPGEVRAFSGLLDRGDTLSYRVTESLSDPAGGKAAQALSRRLLRFSRAPEADQPGDGWTSVHVRIGDESTGVVEEEGLVLMRLDGSGVAFADPAGDGTATRPPGGGRFHPLKVAAMPDTASFRALPPVFILGADWLQTLGALDVSREVEALDTLSYRGRLEECWRVAEQVLDGPRSLSRGRFWYGSSGLLRGEQAWDIEVRGSEGGAAQVRELRRELIRL